MNRAEIARALRRIARLVTTEAQKLERTEAEFVAAGKETCDTCKWWDPRDEDAKRFNCDGRTPAAGGCRSGYIGYGSSLAPPHASELAYWDTEMYNAVALTGPKFGCVHHEPKEDADEVDD